MAEALLSSHLHTTSSGLPVVYDAEALETYFSTPDGAEALTGRLGKLVRVTSGLGVRVGTTFLALLAGLAPPSVGPTDLKLNWLNWPEQNFVKLREKSTAGALFFQRAGRWRRRASSWF